MWSLAKRVMQLGGSISTTFSLCLSSGQFVSDAQTVYSSCSQMFCSDTLIQSGVGVNSSCEGVFIDDTCMVGVLHCGVSGRFERDLNLDGRVQTSLCPFFGVGFSECFFAGRLSEFVQQEAGVSQAVVSLLHFDGKSGDEVESPLVAERTSEPTLTPMGNIIEHQVVLRRPSSSDTKGSKMFAMFNM